MFNKIHVPIDLSDRSLEAAQYAAAIADHFGAEMKLIHVVEPAVDFDFAMIAPSTELSRKTAEATRLRSQAGLEAFAEKALPNRRQVGLEVLHGDPADQILCASRRDRADLIVMPTRGRSRLRQFLIGSVTAKVLHDAAVPVWTGVHMQQMSNFPAFHLSNILCAVDFGSQSAAALRYASHLAAECAAKLTVMHVTQDGSSEALARLEAMVMPTPAEVGVDIGEPRKVVPAVAGQIHADLVVIGRASSTGMMGRLREQAYGIVRDSPCPVLSV